MNISSNKAQEQDDKQKRVKKKQQKNNQTKQTKKLGVMQNQSNLKAKTESVNKVETSKEKNIKILLKQKHEIITDKFLGERKV